MQEPDTVTGTAGHKQHSWECAGSPVGPEHQPLQPDALDSRRRVFQAGWGETRSSLRRKLSLDKPRKQRHVSPASQPHPAREAGNLHMAPSRPVTGDPRRDRTPLGASWMSGRMALAFVVGKEPGPVGLGWLAGRDSPGSYLKCFIRKHDSQKQKARPWRTLSVCDLCGYHPGAQARTFPASSYRPV